MMNRLHDIVGVGIGPFNLSLAALLDETEASSAFFDSKPAFDWHPGLLLDDAMMQTSYLKDLVTCASPTNRHSFVAFLHQHKRLHQFLNADFSYASREEFRQYFQWVASNLESLHFSSRVDSIDVVDDEFEVSVNGRKLRARNIALGTGRSPHVPACTARHLGASVFHGSQFLEREIDYGSKRVAIVGGGQTSAEILLDLLRRRPNQQPSSVCWISRRANFLPLDDSPFVNDYFVPSYVNLFYDLPANYRQAAIAGQRLASDGISMHTLRDVYQLLYRLRFLDGKRDMCSLMPERELFNMWTNGRAWSLQTRNTGLQTVETVDADVVILCTGFENQFSRCLEPLANRIPRDDGQFRVRRDFSIEWDGPHNRRIFVLNAARHTHGVADPNMSLMAWRSATIINSLMDRRLFDDPEERAFLDWPTPEQPSRMSA